MTNPSATSVAATLNDQNADIDVVHQAMRYYLAERFDDISPVAMHATLVERLGETATDSAITSLAADPHTLEHAALLILSGAWTEEPERSRVTAAIDDAKGKLALVEAGLLALVAIYGLYLLATGGIRRSETTAVRRPDGSYEERTIVEYTDPTTALGGLVARLTASGRKNADTSSALPVAPSDPDFGSS